MPNAIVTGATHGIGKAIAQRLLEDGYALGFCARNEQEVKARQDRWQQDFPDRKVISLAADLSDAAQVRKAADSFLSGLETIDVLVNNAGIFLPGSLEQEPEGQLEQLMAVNLFAPYHLTRFLLPALRTSAGAHIINLCSVASLKAYPNGGAYSITKYALLGFSENLREELKEEGIRVTAISPGATASRSWAGSGVPDERIMQAEDVAIMVSAALRLSPGSVAEHIIMRPQLGDL